MHLKHHLAAGVCALLIASPAAAGISGVTYLAFPDSEPLSAAHAPNDPATLYVAHRNGVIRGLDVATGAWDVDPLLEVAGVDTSGEGGLLGMAFHPDFATNHKLYVHATIDPGDARPGVLDPFDSQVLEYTLDPGGAAPTVRTILSVSQPTAFHNGGWIGFNPAASPGEEGLLYLTIGDGDTPASAQSVTSGDLLGKVLRIDPAGDDFPTDLNRNYAIPATNPFAGGPEDSEILAYGLRNPFRSSIDRLNGDLWIGDVGEGQREEVDVVRADSGGGQNFGWNACEGLLSSGACDALKASTTVTDPVYDYAHPGMGPVDFTGVSVIGGVVYRGPDPEVQGRYLFGDVFAPGASYWSLDAADPVGSIANLEPELFPDDNSIGGPVAFAEDLDGNVYILTRFSGIYRIDTDTVVPGDFNADGVVDAADYTVWRDGLGTTYTQPDYATWQANYGATAATWAVPSQGVPEPAAALIVGLALIGLQLAARQR